MFWSGVKLESLKGSLITKENDADGQCSAEIDCASIVLTIGSEVYVTPNSDIDSKVKIRLTDKKSQFILPKGQFALILTEEIVHVPKDAIGFISFKAKYKYKGLINVSGFHVDPGWKGRLIFSVYNAGPSDVVLEKGLPFALIWYADLDTYGVDPESVEYEPYVKEEKLGNNIDSQKITDMTGEIFSPFKLKKDIDDLKEKYTKEINDLRKEINTSEGKLLTQHLGLVVGIVSLLIILFKLPETLTAITNIVQSH